MILEVQSIEIIYVYRKQQINNRSSSKGWQLEIIIKTNESEQHCKYRRCHLYEQRELKDTQKIKKRHAQGNLGGKDKKYEANMPTSQNEKRKH